MEATEKGGRKKSKLNPALIRGVITMRRAHKWAQNVLNLRLKVISFAIMTPSEQFYVS